MLSLSRPSQVAGLTERGPCASPLLSAQVTGDVEWGQATLALPNKVEDTRLSSLVPLVNRKGKEIGQVQLLVTLKARDAAEEAAEQKGQLNGAPSTPRGDGDLSEEAGAGSPPTALSTPTPVEGAALYNPLWQASRQSRWEAGMEVTA